MVRAETKKYTISKHRYYELQHLCYQYDDMRKRLDELQPLGRTGQQCGGQGYTGSATESLAIKRAGLSKKIDAIEKAAIRAGKIYISKRPIDISGYILQSVTNETFKYNDIAYSIPCGKNIFYKARRMFFYYLSEMY